MRKFKISMTVTATDQQEAAEITAGLVEMVKTNKENVIKLGKIAAITNGIETLINQLGWEESGNEGEK